MRNIFVFGSNLAGRHGRGAALHALRNHGAKYGVGWGLQGNSYAIPTKDESLQTLSLERIQYFVTSFLKFSQSQPEWTFNVTRIGCGLAGYRDWQIAPLFSGHPDNVILPHGWDHLIRMSETETQHLMDYKEEVESRGTYTFSAENCSLNRRWLEAANYYLKGRQS